MISPEHEAFMNIADCIQAVRIDVEADIAETQRQINEQYEYIEEQLAMVRYHERQVEKLQASGRRYVEVNGHITTAYNHFTGLSDE